MASFMCPAFPEMTGTADTKIAELCAITAAEVKGYLKVSNTRLFGWLITDFEDFKGTERELHITDFGLNRPPQSWCYAKEVPRMSDRRATVLLLQHGDPEISGAIAEGMLAARARTAAAGTSSAPASRATFPKGEGFWEPSRASEGKTLTHEQIEVVQAEIDRQHIVRSLVRVAVNNTKTAEDYDNMTTKARGMYATPARSGALWRLLDHLFTGYALLCYAIGEAYDAQRRVLGRRP